MADALVGELSLSPFLTHYYQQRKTPELNMVLGIQRLNGAYFEPFRKYIDWVFPRLGRQFHFVDCSRACGHVGGNDCSDSNADEDGEWENGELALAVLKYYKLKL